MSKIIENIPDLISTFRRGEFSSVITNGKTLVEDKNIEKKDVVYNLIGLSYFKQLNYHEAKNCFLKSVDHNKNNFEIYLNLASCYLKLKDFKNSEDYLHDAIKLNPKNKNLHLLMSTILVNKGDTLSGINYLKNIHFLKKDIDALFQIARIYLESNDYQKALETFLTADQYYPNNSGILNNIGICYESLNKFEECINTFRKAFNANNNDISVIINLANAYRSIGNFEEAKVYYNLALSKKEKLFEVHRQLSAMTKYKDPNDPHLKKMLDLNQKSQNESENHELLFAISKAYEDLKDYEKSSEYLVKANDIMKENTNYNIGHIIEQMTMLRQLFQVNYFEPAQISKTAKNPIFIVGMPRSGTTLVEQIISSHSKVYSGGELYFLQKQIKKYFPSNDNLDFKKEVVENLDQYKSKIADGYLNDLGGLTNFSFATDKLPFNFLFIGFIKTCLPNAKIIHIRRNSRDNCFSIYKNYFPLRENAFSYDQLHLAKYYNSYRDLMQFWKEKYHDIFEIDYEHLVSDQLNQTKKLIEHCGLEWEEGCLEFYKNKTMVKTLSTAQVRNKMYSSSVNAWENYKSILSTLDKNLKY